MAFVHTQSGTLHYQVSGAGEGPALVFINSLGTDSRIWDDVAGPLSAQYRVITYDKRGHGMSSTPTGAYTLADHLHDLEAILDAAGVDEVFVCGVSIGGLIAQGFADYATSRVKALILCNTAAKIGTAESWNERIKLVQEQGVGAIAGAILERWFSPGYIADKPNELAIWKTGLSATDAAGYAGCCATLRDSDLTAKLSAISVPVLVIGGTEDRATPIELVTTLVHGIAHARFFAIEGVGHIPSIEAPKLLTEQISNFLMETRHGR